jgi:hypothetical protein
MSIFDHISSLSIIHTSREYLANGNTRQDRQVPGKALDLVQQIQENARLFGTGRPIADCGYVAQLVRAQHS